MATEKVEASSLQTWTWSRAFDGAELISVVAVKLVRTSQSQDQAGSLLGALFGSESYSYKVTDVPNDIEVQDERHKDVR